MRGVSYRADKVKDRSRSLLRGERGKEFREERVAEMLINPIYMTFIFKSTCNYPVMR